jgi:D-serine deaminase-like pyridoxal phosphate-dependent protein
MVTIDAGIKAFATDVDVPPLPLGGRERLYAFDWEYRFTGDEHGALVGDTLPGLGGRITLIPPHCDPTVNLYDRYWIVDGDTVTDIWPITARGCST